MSDPRDIVVHLDAVDEAQRNDVDSDLRIDDLREIVPEQLDARVGCSHRGPFV